MSKRTKKYTPLKQQHRATTRLNMELSEAFKYAGIVCNVLDEDKSYLHEENPLPPLTKSKVQHHLFNCKHIWTVYGAVCFKESNGKNKVKIIDLSAPFPVLFGDVTNSIYEAHKDFLYSFIDQYERICGYGFIAYASDEPKEDKLLMAMLENAGCFDGSFVAEVNEGRIEFKEQ